MYIQGNPTEIQTTNTMEPYWPQHDGPVDCVIAHQYSSGTFPPTAISLPQRKHWCEFQMCYYFTLYHFNIA